MNKKQSQSGSAHLAVIIILVVALIGALGYVFYLNFIQSGKNITPVASITKLTNSEALAVGQDLYAKANSAYEEGLKTTEADFESAGLLVVTNLDEATTLFTADGKAEYISQSGITGSGGNYYTPVMATTEVNYKGTDALVIKSVESEKITFTATSNYGRIAIGDNTPTKIDRDFIIKKQDGNWKIDKFIYPRIKVGYFEQFRKGL